LSGELLVDLDVQSQAVRITAAVNAVPLVLELTAAWTRAPSLDEIATGSVRSRGHAVQTAQWRPQKPDMLLDPLAKPGS
jgi:hypothetical protein